MISCGPPAGARTCSTVSFGSTASGPPPWPGSAVAAPRTRRPDTGGGRGSTVCTSAFESPDSEIRRSNRASQRPESTWPPWELSLDRRPPRPLGLLRADSCPARPAHSASRARPTPPRVASSPEAAPNRRDRWRPIPVPGAVDEYRSLRHRIDNSRALEKRHGPCDVRRRKRSPRSTGEIRIRRGRVPRGRRRDDRPPGRSQIRLLATSRGWPPGAEPEHDIIGGGDRPHVVETSDAEDVSPDVVDGGRAVDVLVAGGMSLTDAKDIREDIVTVVLVVVGCR